MRAVVATTVVWIVSRAAFWIGYHRGPQYRSVGLTGMVQSMLVLLYDCGRFGYDVAGHRGRGDPADPVRLHRGLPGLCDPHPTRCMNRLIRPT